MMGMFRKVGPETRIQSLGEMIAYSLRSEITRASWERDGDELVNGTLNVRIPRCLWRDGVTVRGRPVPLTGSDEYKIDCARDEWIDWDDECRRAEAMVNFVEAFEMAASGNWRWANEARSALGKDAKR